ncbi:MAG: ribosome biogenesis GTP-binding protein YihA/YsxC [Bdellovibrionota bacterium]|nr:MAG: ribosome biogenesis GTP-binding protein YsxC [Pseudomonadota bacterium]
METRYITSALKPEQLPVYQVPEVAFIGRSNSGKSTLLNQILGRKSLARKGSTPGQTQMVNFFGLAEKLIFADLPGYGFSAINKNVAAEWQPLVDAYLQRQNICEFLFLIDIRRDFNEQDWFIIDLLSRNLSVYVVLTKSDKLSRQEQVKRVKFLKDEMDKKGIDVKKLLPVSSLKSDGIKELREDIFAHIPVVEE